jgi:hypothetical protein
VSGVPRSVRVSRVIRAPADQLFRAWTDPQELQHWWHLDENGWECVEAIVVPPESLRALLVAEAELGERILRALILRRLALIELGFGGPVLVGTLKSPDVTRLSHFLERNAIPFRVVDPDEDTGWSRTARALRPDIGRAANRRLDGRGATDPPGPRNSTRSPTCSSSPALIRSQRGSTGRASPSTRMGSS